ncbi:SDR family oxidoreductase [Eubacteriales bacterium OttesenSCG-928-A19]|nr:SDR family oxidoreductase [Eubacteriales bacterium OttesenSCG-928-A19]
MRLKNQVAIVTGAGAGMGRAIAKLFAQEGANVVAADIREDGVTSLIAETKGAPGRIVYRQTDVSNQQQVESMIDFAVESFGKLDILVNNAGIMDNMVPVAELTNEMWERVMGVNLNSVLYASRKAVQVMCNNNGRIINIASVGGLYGARAGAAYTASKFGVVGLTRNIGFMYAKEGIRCNAIAPGGIETNIGVNMQDVNVFGMERMQTSTTSMPRQGKPEEVAYAALFLASDESSFVNGTVLTVDGGWTAI